MSLFGAKNKREISREIRYSLVNRDFDEKTKLKMENKLLSIGNVEDILLYLSEKNPSMRNKFENFILDQNINSSLDAYMLTEVINNVDTLNKAQLEVKLIQSKCVKNIVRHLISGKFFDEISLTKIVLEQGNDRELWDIIISGKELKDGKLLIDRLKELNEFAYHIQMHKKNKSEFKKSDYEKTLISFCNEKPLKIDNKFLVKLLKLNILENRDFFEGLLLSSNDLSNIKDYYFHSELVFDRNKFELKIYEINNILAENLNDSVITAKSMIVKLEYENHDLVKESKYGRHIIAAAKSMNAILDMYHKERKHEQYPRHLHEQTHIANFKIINKYLLEDSLLHTINCFDDDFFPIQLFLIGTHSKKSDLVQSLLMIKNGLKNRTPFLEILHDIHKRDRWLTIGDHRKEASEELKEELRSKYGNELYPPTLLPYK